MLSNDFKKNACVCKVITLYTTPCSGAGSISIKSKWPEMKSEINWMKKKNQWIKYMCMVLRILEKASWDSASMNMI